MTTETVLRARHDLSLPGRLAKSAAITGAGAVMATAEFTGWLAERAAANSFRVDRVPLSELDAWSADPATGNLGHRSGKFFTVEGLHVVTGEGPFPEWQQPIINQPEVGILGLLVKEIDGVLHFLMQAKMEPGNPNLVQLSPTVQATRSNYTKAHKGAAVKYLDYFTEPRRATVLLDVLQSEHGAWFFRKFNRNIIVETQDEVVPDDEFCWLTLGQIGELLRLDNVVNMDARTILACAPMPYDEAGALRTDADLRSWYAAERSRHSVQARRIPLSSVDGWAAADDGSIVHERDWYFRVMGVRVQATNREVAAWTQPLFEPRAMGLAAFLVRRFGRVPHLLAHARIEGGFLDAIELGPTVQYTPKYYEHLSGSQRPPFLDLVATADPARIRYDVVHSEEGGRFLNAEGRYLIVEADEATAPADPPPGYHWFTPGQLNTLVSHGRYVNVQARTLLAALNTYAVEL
ncbi:NDP-hexose 2,3-dehydratase family protein [Actinocrispum wychmicini]|uniref:Oxidase EvaA n=1 Tax=Actinocrispum wychmicini TaxID=1213861 RepID=A0A4R2K3A5_9PSEU|nr:NDP-hexose 2,3-dehydratase family protein [Actinocrispum wychmicini]TCO60785.1 oxidase EvaA [Actinocrispum wychmicini]